MVTPMNSVKTTCLYWHNLFPKHTVVYWKLVSCLLHGPKWWLQSYQRTKKISCTQYLIASFHS